MEAVDTLIVDKTGTLTMGKPKLTDTVALGDMLDVDLLSLAAALERGSEHPLAEAIVEGAETQGAARQVATDFEAVTGKGVRSEEHTSELQSLMRISYAVFCLTKKTHMLL